MNREVLARLEPEDLKRWQVFAARLHALEVNPTAFTKDESIQIMLERYEQAMEMQTKYHLPDDELWQVDPNSGTVYLEEG